MHPYQLTIHQLAALLRKGELSSVEIVKSVFDRIEAVEDKTRTLNAVADRVYDRWLSHIAHMRR